MAMTLRTDDELDAALAELAELEGLSRQEVIRRAILERLAELNHRQAVEQSGTAQADRWAHVLERLGTV